jgi:hypothetical protein
MTDTAFLTHAGTLLIGVGTGIVIHAKLWWKNKTIDEKKEAIDDALAAMGDGKITVAEARELIKKHL